MVSAQGIQYEPGHDKTYKQFGERISQRTIVSSLVEIYPVITKEMLLEAFFLLLALVAILCSRAERFE